MVLTSRENRNKSVLDSLSNHIPAFHASSGSVPAGNAACYQRPPRRSKLSFTKYIIPGGRTQMPYSVSATLPGAFAGSTSSCTAVRSAAGWYSKWRELTASAFCC